MDAEVPAGQEKYTDLNAEKARALKS